MPRQFFRVPRTDAHFVAAWFGLRLPGQQLFPVAAMVSHGSGSRRYQFSGSRKRLGGPGKLTV
ncbi:hypothetical protein HispidOSU_005641 [Sigmodon hispidus]